MQFKYLKILEMKTYFEIRLQDGKLPISFTADFRQMLNNNKNIMKNL